ncbi:Aste57867_22820 [Aphanomyces stellatus]|uniref:Aste57867_22820 protein n=1 Tax=Aphanomyces stellatus TaxID=120398 RepID=A0A485LL76_9STRA|nr:hypothetical protein As57867_022750 [Aphanomyces stellatus]VFT99471.1 Aste57867_22820 [Aphanomyces stellatus]
MSAGRSFLSISALLVLAIAVFTAYFSHSSNMRLQALKTKNANAFFPGQTALVVGGTSGIGEGIARRLAEAHFNVIVAGRSAERGNAIVREMQTVYPEGTFRFLAVDSFLLANIRGLAASVPSLDKLVLTQGMATIQGYTPTSEGIDQKLALHYYGRMAFIQEFLPVLRQSTHSPRVLSVLSAGIHSPYALFRVDPELQTHYSIKNAADAAGFYNDLMLDAWSADPANAGIAFGHAAPGFVSTNWGTEMPWIIRVLIRPLQRLLGRSKADCGEFMSDFLLADDVVPGGRLHLMDQYGEPANVTAAHTDDAKLFMREHTLERINRGV